MTELKITGSNQVNFPHGSIFPGLILDVPALISEYQTAYPDVAIKAVTAYIEGLRLRYITESLEATSIECAVLNNDNYLQHQIICLPNEVINAKPFITYGGLRMLGKNDQIFINPTGLSAGESIWADIEYRLIFFTL